MDKSLKLITYLLPTLICGLLVFSSFTPKEKISFSSQTILQDSIPFSYLDTVIAWDNDLGMSMVTISKIYPGIMEETQDTVAIYDPETEEEVIKVVLSEHLKTVILYKEPYFGTYFVTDTITTFDPISKRETVEYQKVKVFKKKN